MTYEINIKKPEEPSVRNTFVDYFREKGDVVEEVYSGNPGTACVGQLLENAWCRRSELSDRVNDS